MKMNVGFVMFALVLGLTTVSCGRRLQDANGLSGKNGTVVADNAGSLMVGGTATFRATSDRLPAYDWRVTSEDGVDLTGDCMGQGTPELTCELNVGGNITVTLNGSANSFNILDDNAANQAPAISCRMSSGGQLIRIINSMTARDAFFTAVVQGQAVTFDCSATTDDSSALSELQFQVRYSASEAFQNVGSSFSHTFAAASTYAMAIKVTDKDGLSIEKSFTVPVRCSQTAMAALDINTSAVTVAPGGYEGFFNYNATGAVSGGQAPYFYAWDFNGDGATDMHSSTTPILWQSGPTATNAYSNFGDVRQVQLIVRDSCQNFVAKSIPLNIQLPRITGPATQQAFHYLQGDVSRTAGNMDLRKTDVKYMGVQPRTAPDNFKRVLCTYNLKYANVPQGLKITGLNAYDNWVNPALKHGMEIRVQNILDRGTMGTQTFSSSDANPPVLDQANWQVAEAGDGSPRAVYNKTSQACTVNLRIIRAVAQKPCNNDPAIVEADTLTMLGEFSCPQLQASTGETVKVDDGKFFCEFSVTNQCVGGGGGGGGGQPPPAQ